MNMKSMMTGAKLGVFGLLAAAMAFSSGCGSNKSIESTKDFHFLPSNCAVIGTSRVDEVVKSTAYKDMMAKIKAMAKDEDPQANMEQEFGLSDRDMARITFGMAENGKDFSMVVTSQKPVTASDLKGKLKSKVTTFGQVGATIGDVGAGKVEIVPPKTELKPRTFKEVQVGKYTLHVEDNNSMAFCVADPQTVVFGSPATLKAILERDKKIELSAGMKGALALADQSQPIFVAIDAKGVMAGEAKKAVRDLPPQVGGHADKIEALAIETALGDDAKIKVVALCKDAAAAEAIQKDADKGLKDAKAALGVMPKPPAEFASLFDDLTKVLDSVKVTAGGNKVTGGMSIKPVTLLSAIDSFGRQTTTTFEKVGTTIGEPPTKDQK